MNTKVNNMIQDVYKRLGYQEKKTLIDPNCSLRFNRKPFASLFPSRFQILAEPSQKNISSSAGLPVKRKTLSNVLDNVDIHGLPELGIMMRHLSTVSNGKEYSKAVSRIKNNLTLNQRTLKNVNRGRKTIVMRNSLSQSQIV